MFLLLEVCNYHVIFQDAEGLKKRYIRIRHRSLDCASSLSFHSDSTRCFLSGFMGFDHVTNQIHPKMVSYLYSIIFHSVCHSVIPSIVPDIILPDTCIMVTRWLPVLHGIWDFIFTWDMSFKNCWIISFWVIHFLLVFIHFLSTEINFVH